MVGTLAERRADKWKLQSTESNYPGKTFQIYCSMESPCLFQGPCHVAAHTFSPSIACFLCTLLALILHRLSTIWLLVQTENSVVEAKAVPPSSLLILWQWSHRQPSEQLRSVMMTKGNNGELFFAPFSNKITPQTSDTLSSCLRYTRLL